MWVVASSVFSRQPLLGRASCEQHRSLSHAGELGQALCLSGIGVAGGVPGVFGDRRCNQGLAMAALHLLDGRAEPMKAGIAAGGASLARLQWLLQGAIQHLEIGRVCQGGCAAAAQVLVALLEPTAAAHQQGFGVLRRPVGQRLEGDFRADSGWVAEGNGQASPLSVLKAGLMDHAALGVVAADRLRPGERRGERLGGAALAAASARCGCALRAAS